MGWRRRVLRRKRVLSTFLCAVLLIVFVQGSEAVDIDKRKTLEVLGRAQTRVSIRLQDSDGFTQPADIKVGNMVQWRNLAMIEINHDLKRLTKQLDILYPLKVLKIRAKYHLVGRFMYEAVYNVGPTAFQDVRDRDKENIDNFKQSYDLWEAYLDLSRGPMFFRIGKQNLAWGETDVFRLLDGINPMDNTFGGVFEDIDDRRIPLWMLRGSYNFGRVGPVSTLTVEGFWVPGNLDSRVAPLAPTGTAYAAPQPEAPIPAVTLTPSKTMSNSRWGGRLMGMLFDNYSFTIAHYRSYLDTQTLRLDVGANPLDAELQVSYPDVQVTGASLSFWQEQTDVIVRTELAWFWDEPVFIPDINAPLIPFPFPIPGLPGLPANGSIPKKDVFRWVIGLDKNVWIRPLNKKRTFMVSMQYFGTWYQDYDERMALPAALYPDSNKYTSVKEVESIFTFLMTSDFSGGDIIPQLVVAYDTRGVWMFQPSVNYNFEPFRFMIQYSGIVGNMTGFGVFRDRDQITFILSYLLN